MMASVCAYCTTSCCWQVYVVLELSTTFWLESVSSCTVLQCLSVAVHFKACMHAWVVTSACTFVNRMLSAGYCGGERNGSPARWTIFRIQLTCQQIDPWHLLSQAWQQRMYHILMSKGYLSYANSLTACIRHASATVVTIVRIESKSCCIMIGRCKITCYYV